MEGCVRNGFEDLQIWKDGIDLTVKTYSVLNSCKDYGFKDQIQRAAVSIPSNISEGYERHTNKELINFLYIAKGSCGEYRTQLKIAYLLHYINHSHFINLNQFAKTLSSKIYSFIKFVENKTVEGSR